MPIATETGRLHFSTPVRWTLRVLAWLAFGVSSYLAWHAVNQSSVAGCGVGTQNGCDAVLHSSWSRWLGIPVAVAGLACYATLATLSVLLDWPLQRARRWITTFFTMLALVAGVASLWFIGVQVFAIGEFCRYCIVTDVCGIALAALAIWSATRWRSASSSIRDVRQSTAGLMALRSALPAGNRSTPAMVAPNFATHSLSPSLPLAIGGASALVILLVGGQLLFPGKTHDLRKVALNQSIAMDESQGKENNVVTSPTAQERVAMRPTEPEQETATSGPGEAGVEPTAAPNSGDPLEPVAASAPASVNGSAESSPSAPAGPKRQRLVKFFNGKLTLDTYKHPIIGSPEAPHVVVEMVSYDCPHCRKMHRIIQDAKTRYGDQVAVLVMVIPMEKGCNKLVVDSAASHAGACTTARMALGVAALKPAAFAKFHDWLMAGKEKPPELDRVVAKAYEIVDRGSLRELSDSDQLKKQIEGYVNLYHSLGTQSNNKNFGLPVQILGDHVMAGEVKSADDVFKAWEEHLGVKPN